MSASLLYHTQQIYGFQFSGWNYSSGTVYADIIQKRDKQCCTACLSYDITPSFVKIREIKALPMGCKQLVLRVHVHRLRCHRCGAFRQEKLPFLHSPKARISKALARSILEMRSEMSIKAVAAYFDLHWETVKNVEKQNLKQKFRSIRLRDVKIIGIDEIHTGRKKGFLTIVRDLESGAVLHVGKGKGEKGLKGFGRRLKQSRCRIEAAAVDMAPGYTLWLKNNLKETVIVYDHFHVIKLMNQKIDSLRRTTMADADESMKDMLKNSRWLWLKSPEKLKENQKERLEVLRNVFDELSTAVFMRDCLRKIYRMAIDDTDAELCFEFWCQLAEGSGISCLKTMAKTIRSKMEGILAYWNQNGLTSAGMEGFNNKIRWLIRQAYGFRDQEYFKLKIFDLPNIKTEKEL